MANSEYNIVAASVTDLYEVRIDSPTMHLRWNGNILEQRWQVESWSSMGRGERKVDHEWRPVPQKEDGA